ncbi:MAG: hypothetical protein WC492_00860 [Candidatus Micrarchaeia archaeon]
MSRPNVRGGAELRKRAGTIRAAKCAKYPCPRTGKKTRRVSHSLWESAGGYVYAGGAYALSTPTGEVFDRMLKEQKAKSTKKK